MKHIYLLIGLFLLMTSCKSSLVNNTQTNNPEKWFYLGITEGFDVYTDTASIRTEGAVAYAREKRVYTTAESRKQYVDKIRAEYQKMGKPEKADKWNDFSYCIYECVYECMNKRFRVLSVEDYDSADKLILKTTPNKKNIKWLNVESETVGDYTFFFVCDFKN